MSNVAALVAQVYTKKDEPQAIGHSLYATQVPGTPNVYLESDVAGSEPLGLVIPAAAFGPLAEFFAALNREAAKRFPPTHDFHKPISV